MNVDISPEELEQIKRLCEGLFNKLLRIDEVKKLAQMPENEDETIDETETKVTFTMSFDAVKRPTMLCGLFATNSRSILRAMNAR